MFVLFYLVTIIFWFHFFMSEALFRTADALHSYHIFSTASFLSILNWETRPKPQY